MSCTSYDFDNFAYPSLNAIVNSDGNQNALVCGASRSLHSSMNVQYKIINLMYNTHPRNRVYSLVALIFERIIFCRKSNELFLLYFPSILQISTIYDMFTYK